MNAATVELFARFVVAAFLQALGAPRAEFPSSRQAGEPRAESRRVVVVALGAAGVALLIAWRVARRRRVAR